MNKTINCRYLINKLANYLISFLNNELNIKATATHFVLHHIQTLELKYITTVINVEGKVKAMVLISYEEALFAEIFTRYTADLVISDDEKDEAIADSAGDIINIVVGRTLAEVNNQPQKILISPPLTITAAKQLACQRNTLFYKANLETDLGQLDIYLVSNTIGEDDE